MEHEPTLEAAFGAVVRELRTRAGLSQERLAEMAGLHRNYVGLVERGANSPSLRALASLAAALETKPWELVQSAEGRLAELRAADS